MHRPLRMRGGVLPGLEGYFRRKAAMHPSGGALDAASSPYRGAFCVRRADGGNGSGDRRLCACEMRGRGLLGKEEPFKELIVY